MPGWTYISVHACVLQWMWLNSSAVAALVLAYWNVQKRYLCPQLRQFVLLFCHPAQPSIWTVRAAMSWWKVPEVGISWWTCNRMLSVLSVVNSVKAKESFYQIPVAARNSTWYLWKHSDFSMKCYTEPKLLSQLKCMVFVLLTYNAFFVKCEKLSLSEN